MGKPTEVFDTKMAGLHADATKTKCFIENMPQNRRPEKIVFYADNTGAIHRIFEGSPGKAQAHSRGFRKEICSILNADDESIVAISWCPRHQDVVGNEEADKLAKLGSKLIPQRPNYKMQAYVMGLHKQEMLEAWQHRWSNTPNPPSAWFQLANKFPPMLKPTKCFISTDQKTFSRLIQC